MTSCRFVKEKRPTISPNFNFLGQLLDFEKKLKSDAAVRPRAAASDEQKPCGSDPLEPLTMPCVLAGVPEEHLLARALCGLQLGEDPEESGRPKRSFSLDIKTYGETGAPLRAFADKPPCQFSPVREVSEQNTPEQSPDKERDGRALCPQTLQRSGSVDESPSGGPPHSAVLKGWHSDIVLGGWFLSSESARFYSTSAVFGGGAGCAPGLEAVRRRGRQRSGDCGDSRRSWHEESSFEKQLKRRSCQMEFGDGVSETRSGEELGAVGGQSSFSGSMEIIEVS